MATTKPLRHAISESAASTNGAGAATLGARILDEAHEIERDCRIAVVCHGSAATAWTYAYYLLGLPTAILAALAGLSAISDHPHWAAGLAVAATVSAAANTFLNAGQTANAHGKKRSEYEQLKNEIRHFRNITLATPRPEREFVRELNRHGSRRDVLNLESPQVSGRAHARASDRVKGPDELDPAADA